MKYSFMVTMETDEATQEELEEAITDMLQVAKMPNGDTLYINHPKVEYMPPNATVFLENTVSSAMGRGEPFGAGEHADIDIKDHGDE